MSKPGKPDESYSELGDHIYLAGIYGNVVHNITQSSKTGKVTVWFQKIKGQRYQGVAEWMIQFFLKAGADVFIVDLFRSGNPYQITQIGVGDEPHKITATQLRLMMRSRGTLRNE